MTDKTMLDNQEEFFAPSITLSNETDTDVPETLSEEDLKILQDFLASAEPEEIDAVKKDFEQTVDEVGDESETVH